MLIDYLYMFFGKISVQLPFSFSVVFLTVLFFQVRMSLKHKRISLVDITVDFSELIKEENKVINANIENTVESESNDMSITDDEKGVENENTDDDTN